MLKLFLSAVRNTRVMEDEDAEEEGEGERGAVEVSFFDVFFLFRHC